MFTTVHLYMYVTTSRRWAILCTRAKECHNLCSTVYMYIHRDCTVAQASFHVAFFTSEDMTLRMCYLG